MCKMKKPPQPQAPAPAPAPPAAAAEILQAEPENQDNLLERAAKRGRKSLRIDRSGDIGGLGGGAGVNTPQG